MVIADVSTFAAALRQEGFEARSLAHEGLTIWKNGEGFYFSLDELRALRGDPTARGFDTVLAERRQQRPAA